MKRYKKLPENGDCSNTEQLGETMGPYNVGIQVAELLLILPLARLET